MATQASPTIPTGALVATDRRGDRNTKLVMVVTDHGGIVQAVDAAAGMQLAEYGETGYLVFVRLTGATSFCRNWSHTAVTHVHVWDVDTVVVDGVIMAGVGNPRPSGMVRSDALGASL